MRAASKGAVREQQAEKALRIVVALASTFADESKPISGADLVDWLAARLQADGFLK